MTMFLGCRLGQKTNVLETALCPPSGSMASLVDDKTVHLIISLH
jgi:hypothetical protein